MRASAVKFVRGRQCKFYSFWFGVFFFFSLLLPKTLSKQVGKRQIPLSQYQIPQVLPQFQNLTRFSTWQKDRLNYMLEVLVTLSSEQQQKRTRHLRLLSMNISQEEKKINSEKEQVSN